MPRLPFRLYAAATGVDMRCLRDEVSHRRDEAAMMRYARQIRYARVDTGEENTESTEIE